MKKVLSIALVLVMVVCFAACGGNDNPQPKPEEPKYVGLELNFKNKTGATITGLYLYASGSEDKGNSICPTVWQDKDADKEGYEFNAYLYREAATEKFDLYVTFEDGTDATWAGLTINNYDKLSLKGGKDVSAWEQEPVDEEDKPAMDALKTAGKATDGFYPGFTTIRLELKNKTSKKGTAHTIKALYVYAKGSEDKGANILANVYPNGMEEGAEYIFGYVVRATAEVYNLETVFDDDTSIIYEATEFTTKDGDGRYANEISIQSETDPDVWKVQYDDGEACLGLLQKAVMKGVSYVNEEAPEEFPSLDAFVPTIAVK